MVDNFENWAKDYALDSEPLNIESRHFDCFVARQKATDIQQIKIDNLEEKLTIAIEFINDYCVGTNGGMVNGNILNERATSTIKEIDINLSSYRNNIINECISVVRMNYENSDIDELCIALHSLK